MEYNTFKSECDTIAMEIDRLVEAKDVQGLVAALARVDEVIERHEKSECASLFYYLGNGYSALSAHYQEDAAKNAGSEKLQKKYKRLALQKLRKAIMIWEQQMESCEDTNELLCIYTNYANELVSCGRVIEAIRIYRKTLDIDPQFGMATGNYGRCLGVFANHVNDPGHHKELHCYAYQALCASLKMDDPCFHEDARKVFAELVKQYDSIPDSDYLSEPIVFDEYDLGDCAERTYRIWCLEHHLFLNPLNDVIEIESAFAHDPLTITRFTESEVIDEAGDVVISPCIEPPKWFAMLNQLKEEYIYARYLCYAGIEKRKTPHFADQHVNITLASYDYTNYSVRVEQLKSAYRILFALLDQIAFAINEFWNIGLEEKAADAYHVFNRKEYPKDNVALTALYWCHCEFTEVYGDAEKASEKDLKTLRNALEHKFVKIHEFPWKKNLTIAEDSFYHISEEDMIRHTVRLLELAREWIMEFVYAIDIEEKQHKHKGRVFCMSVAEFEDGLKL